MANVERIGRRVRELREEQLFSRADLAERSGVSEIQIGRLETAQVTRPRRRTVEKIAAVLGVPIKEILDEEATAGKGSAPESGPLPKSREEAAFAIVGRVVADPRGDERYRMVVQWNVPPEKREAYRKDLRTMLGDDYLEEEMSPQTAELLTSASG